MRVRMPDGSGGTAVSDAGSAADSAAPTHRPARGPGVTLAPVRGQRRPWVFGLGALLATLGALSVVWLVGAAGQRQEVLAVRTDVTYGQELTAADVTLARVSVDPGVAVVPWAERSAVIGQVATTHLSPGMLLTSGMVEPVGEPAVGRVLVPLALPAKRLPAAGLRAGDRILVVGPDRTAPIAATVVRVAAPDIDGISVVDVTTSPGAGTELAATAAESDVALVVEARGR